MFALCRNDYMDHIVSVEPCQSCPLSEVYSYTGVGPESTVLLRAINEMQLTTGNNPLENHISEERVSDEHGSKDKHLM